MPCVVANRQFVLVRFFRDDNSWVARIYMSHFFWVVNPFHVVIQFHYAIKANFLASFTSNVQYWSGTGACDDNQVIIMFINQHVFLLVSSWSRRLLSFIWCIFAVG